MLDNTEDWRAPGSSFPSFWKIRGLPRTIPEMPDHAHPGEETLEETPKPARKPRARNPADAKSATRRKATVKRPKPKEEAETE